MFRYSFIFLCTILVLSNVDIINAKKGYTSRGHSYPRGGGLSGGGGHYPSSGSHHPQSGGSHYPQSGTHGGLSGGGSGYPSGGNSHQYPPSQGGLSGNGGRYPASGNNHGYPPSGGLSGSGSNSHSYPNGRAPQSNNGGHTTIINNHYNYNPPQHIQYRPVNGGPPVSYPVYRGTPPTYVYQYKNSGSKYGTLLAGLALFNLGALAGGAYGYSQGHHSSGSYKGEPGEVCKFGIQKPNGEYDVTIIKCELISSFIYAEQAKAQNQPQNSTVTTTTVTNTTVVNTSNSVPAPAQPGPTDYTMFPNGTLIPMNVTGNATANVTSDGSPAAVGGNMTSSSVTVTTTTTEVKAVDVKGDPVKVNPGMQCFVMRKTRTNEMKKFVPCEVFQSYSDRSLKRTNSAARNIPAFTILAIVCSVFVMY